MLSAFKIRTRLAVMATVPLVLIGLLMGSSYFLIKHLAVNGPAYERIVTSKDFITEVHAPRLYLLQSELLAQRLARPESEPGARAGVRGEFDQVQIAYVTAFDEWEARLTDPKEKEYLRESRTAADTYFSVYRQKFLPLLDDGKDAQALAVLDNEMQVAFLQHQSAIEKIVGQTTANIATAETRASQTTEEQMAVLALCMLLLVGLSALLGFSTVRSITGRIRKLAHVATVELPEVIDNVKKSTLAGDESVTYRPIELGGNDELTEAAQAFNAVLGTAVELASQQSKMRRATGEMFVNLGRRNHKLLSRTLSYISELERDERDPSTLQKLFKLDHLATRMRRHAESLLVLAGSPPLRTWSRAVPVVDVVRSALSEIEAYDRVDISSLEPMAVKGSVVTDLAHLMAELLENATTFSPPHTRVRVLGRGGPDGYTLVVVDEGIGMTPQEMALANHHLAIAGADLMRLPGNSRMLGLGVVGRLAARHELVVDLADAPLGGTVARATIPHALLEPPKPAETESDEPGETGATPVQDDMAPEMSAVFSEAASVFARATTPAPAIPAPSAPAPSAPAAAPSVPASVLPAPVRAARPAPTATPSAAAPAPAIPIPTSSTGTSALPAQPSAPIEAGSRVPLAPETATPEHPAPAPSAAAAPGTTADQAAVTSRIPAQPGAADIGARHPGQSPAEPASSLVDRAENVYSGSPLAASSVTVGTQVATPGSLPARKPGPRPSSDETGTATAPQPNIARDSEVQPPSGTAAEATSAVPAPTAPSAASPAPEPAPAASSEVPAPAVETIGGLRRRVRGENLPETGDPEPQEPVVPRDAAGVRAALSSFKAGRDLANRDT